MAKSEYAKSLDRIARTVYDRALKEHGFKKQERIFSRRAPQVEEGLVQIIELVQGPGFCGQHVLFGTEVGIYVPEFHAPDRAEPRRIHACDYRNLCWRHHNGMAGLPFPTYHLENCDEEALAEELITLIRTEYLPLLDQFRTRDQILENWEKSPERFDHVIMRDKIELLNRMGRREEAIAAMNDTVRYCMENPKREVSIAFYRDLTKYPAQWDLPLEPEVEQAMWVLLEEKEAAFKIEMQKTIEELAKHGIKVTKSRNRKKKD